MTISERLKKFNIDDDYITEEEEISPELFGLCEELTKALSKKIAAIPIWFDYSRQEQQELISSFLNAQLNEQFSEIKLTTKEIERISNKFYESIYGFGSLDFLIARRDITKIFVNSPVDVYIERKGEIEKTDVIIDEKQFLSLINWLIDLSKKNSSIITFRFRNLLITVIREPVCKTKIVLKKICDTLFNFELFEFKIIRGNFLSPALYDTLSEEEKQLLKQDISDFLRYLIENQKRILISSPAQCGKTSFINALINELESDIRITLFEEGGLINTNKLHLNRYDTEGLSDKEQKHLITAALYYKPQYVFSDINNVGFNIEVADILDKNTGFVSTVRANSPVEALSFYTSVLVSKLKCTEKLAKTQFVKDYDYIIQLDKNDELFLLKAIYEVSTNKSGTAVLTEVLNNKAGNVTYKFENIDRIVNTPEPTDEFPPQNISFSARFGM